MIWTLPRFAGQLLDALLGQAVHALGGPPPERRSSPWSQPTGSGDRPTAGGAAGGGAAPSAAGSATASAWTANLSGPAASGQAAATARDKSLAGDDTKLVRYAVVSVRPCRERLLPGGSGEVLVTSGMSGESFAAWIVARYLQSEAYRDAVERDRREEVRHEEKRYLRVAYEVLHRWPSEPRSGGGGKVKALKGIREALRDLRFKPPPAAAPSPPAEPPVPPVPASVPLEAKPARPQPRPPRRPRKPPATAKTRPQAPAAAEPRPGRRRPAPPRRRPR